MTYREGDVRDPEALQAAFAGADVVVHLAFMITGRAPRATIRAINVEGTLNTFRAAAAAGVTRFVYASSVAAYGFGRDNPVGMTEDWPTRPAEHLFYAREKAEIEERLAAAAAEHPSLGLYVLRPPVVLGPHSVGAKSFVPAPRAARSARSRASRCALPLRAPVLVPRCELQLIHEDDVGEALRLCVLGAGPPGAYNIAGDGVLTVADIARELGFLPVAVPRAPAQSRAGPHRRAAVRAAVGRVGRGALGAGDHGRREGAAGAGVGAAVHRAGGAARRGALIAPCGLGCRPC